MHIGLPKEVKIAESRISLIPDDARVLCASGHEVFVQAGAGVGSGYSDEAYQQAGCNIVSDANTLYSQSRLIVKVKEPQKEEFDLLGRDHILFCYLHLAAEPELTAALLKNSVTAIAFETITNEAGGLPLLQPMSEIAGTLAVHYGAINLHKNYAGKGVLLGDVTGVQAAKVTVLGYGSAGSAAVRIAGGMGAQVTVVDLAEDKLNRAFNRHPGVAAFHAEEEAAKRAVIEADLLVGAVLVPGDRAPRVVSAEQVDKMENGSVIVDIAIDQGGCVETSHPTSYQNPTYQVSGVTHFAVTNMPSAVSRSATQALSSAIISSVLRVANDDWEDDPHLMKGLMLRSGSIVSDVLSA